MSGEATRFFVGRHGRWVPDPLTGEIRALLGEQRARQLDDLTRLAGEEIIGWSDGDFEAVPFADFDAQQAARSLAWERQTKSRENSFRANEEVRVLRGMLRTDPSPDVERRLSAAVTHAQELERQQVSFYDEMDYYRVEDFEFHPHLPWDEQPTVLVHAVAIARERAIRGAEPVALDQSVPGGIVGALPDAEYTEIGTGNLADVLERQREAKVWTYPVSRRDVSAPKSLDELRRFIGDQRYKIMARRAQPLAQWLEGQPSDLVRKRSAELGRPDQDLPRDSAMHERRLTYALANAQLELDVARENVLLETDVEVKAATQRTADQAEEAIARLEGELAPHRQRLDAWMASNDKPLQIAYTDEVAVLDAVDVERHVALARDEPPQHLVDLIGPPDRDLTERSSWDGDRDPTRWPSWDDVARRVEHLRQSGGFDPQRGTSATSLADQLPSELQSDISDLRERVGIEPLPTNAPQAAVESPAFDMG